MKIFQVLINSTNDIPTLPHYIQFCQSQIKKLYPNCQYHLYSGREIEDILRINFSKEVIDSYNTLKPYAFKADFARYCLLYLHGGLYIDLSLLCINSLFLEDKNFFAFRDLPEFSDPWWAVNNSIIYSKPKSNIMKTAIDLVIYHCKTKFCGFSAIDVSGPTVLGKSIMRSQENFNMVMTDGQVTNVNSNEIDIDDEKLISLGYDLNKLIGFTLDENKEVIALRKPGKDGNIQSLGLKGTNNYGHMWLSGDIYS